MDEITISVNEVTTLLANVEFYKAVGPDGLHPKFIRECSRILAILLTILFNKSLKTRKLLKTGKTQY